MQSETLGALARLLEFDDIPSWSTRKLPQFLGWFLKTRTSLDGWLYVPTAILCIYTYVFLYRPIIFSYIFIYIYIAASSSIRWFSHTSLHEAKPRPAQSLGACRCHVCGLARKQHHMLKASSCQWFKTCDDFKKREEILLRLRCRFAPLHQSSNKAKPWWFPPIFRSGGSGTIDPAVATFRNLSTWELIPVFYGAKIGRKIWMPG